MSEITVSEQHKQAIELHQKIIVSANLAQQNIWDMCNGLKTMRDNKLYKELGYPNFEDYCENEVGMKRSNAYNYISIVEKINPENVQTFGQISKSKLMLLATISEPEQAEIAEKLDLENTTVKQLKAEIDRLKDEKQEATDKSIDYCRQLNNAKKDADYYKQQADTSKESYRNIENQLAEEKNKNFKLTNKVQELETVCGLGTVTGLCGANCYHSYSPFMKGIDTPTYSEEELDRMNEEENTPKEYNGKEYTAYEAQQRQRRLETAMRADRQQIELLTQGGADYDTITGAKVRYFQRQDEYVKFSKAMGLPEQWERITVDGKNALGSKLPKKAERFDRRAEYSLDEDNKRIAQTRADEWHDKAKKAKKKSKKIDTGTSQKSDVQKKTVEKAENNDIIKETKQLSLSNVEEFENWQNDYYELNKDVSFSRDDNPSIYRYTGGDYDIINALERGGESLEKVKKRYGEKYVSSLNGVGDEISKELSKFKLNEPLKLKRSVGNVDFITNATSSVEDMRKMIGKKFTEKGFTSTTLCSDTQLAFGGIDKPTRTTLEIIAPKETKGAYLYKISDSPAEFEFLIDKNTTYEVVDAGEREITVKDYKGNYEKKTERFMTLKVVEQ